MRLIDADNLKPDTKTFTSAYSEELTAFYSQEAIDNAPTVATETIKYGEWIEDGYDCGTKRYKCSICGENAISEDDSWGYSVQYIKTDYCPHCGAKMNRNCKSTY